MTIIFVPLGIISLFAGFFAYKMNEKAARDIEQMRIRSRLAEIERQKQAADAGEPPPPVARTRRIRARR